MRRRILVTGGGRGLGAAIVSGLAGAGYDVVFTYRRSAEDATALTERLAGLYPDAAVTARPLDLADPASLEQSATEFASQDLYGFIHNAGQPYDALAAVMSEDKADAAMQVNFRSLARLVKAVLPGMTRTRSGRILAIGSVAALRGQVGNAAYAASKGALLAYCRTLAVETARRGVTVNYVAPGFIDTDMIAPYAAHRQRMEKQIPAGRFAKPDDVAGLVTFLMGEAAAYITGAVLPVDGGLTAMMGVHR